VAIELNRTMRGGWSSVVPSWPRFVVSLVFALAGLLLGAFSWRVLFGAAGRARGLTRGFFFATLARYIPGGIWQPIGQVGSASDSGIPLAQAAVAFPVHTLMYVISGAVIGSGVAVAIPHEALIVRVGAACGLLSLLFLHRRWMAFVLTVARRFIKRIPSPDRLPEQAAILRSFGLNLAAVAAMSIAFGALLSTHTQAFFAFALAWSVGFIFIFVPSGVGIREAVLVALLSAPTATVLAASVTFRIVAVLGELFIAAVVALDAVIRPRPATSPAATQTEPSGSSKN
jgi:uncharacterized membrane protein YbhN (UPF0104 family)